MNRLLLTRVRFAASAIIKPISNSAIFIIPPKQSPSLSLSSFSSHSSSSYTAPPPPPPPLDSSDQDSSSIDDELADVSTEELKKRIKKYEEGDMEQLPLIFEAILSRKLSGKHEDSDDELMKEFQSNTLRDEDDDFSSDEDLSDSDEDFSD